MLQVEVLENLIVSTCLKYHGIDSVAIAMEQTVVENSSLLEEIFNRINGLERRLQVHIRIIF